MKSKMPQIGEAVFCIIYLTFGLISGVYMISVSNSNLIFLYGILTLVLAGGDSFHLIPRIINAFKDDFKQYEFWAGLGLLVSSITMTIFYLILYRICLILAGNELGSFYWPALLIFAGIRIILCLFPQNNWFKKEGNQFWGTLRNLPFIVVGILMVIVCMIIHQWSLAIAIVVSFACYLPVVFLAKKRPMVGMLMIPKTVAYMWMICIGLSMI